MVYKWYIVIFISLCFILNCASQESEVWENFKDSKANGETAILPDFSYAGYMRSEAPIPIVNYKKFDVTDFGARPNDGQSDKKAIIRAIKAAKKHKGGIIYFPKGKYHINTTDDDLSIITISSSKIVFRGEDANASILFFENDLPPADPKKLWTCPYAIQTKVKYENRYITKIVANAKRNSKVIEVEDASRINVGDWLTVKVLDNSPDLIQFDIGPLQPDKEWTAITEKGVRVEERHQVAAIKGNRIELKSVLHYNIDVRYRWDVFTFEHVNHIGFESLTFEGNWTKKFKHHRSAQDDGGWSILKIADASNSWIKDCKFKNVSNAASFSHSANCTAINVVVEGNLGHSAVHASRSTNILIACSNDSAGMHHSFGVDGNSSGTVIWRSKYAAHSCFESHASQPRNTLFDKVEGGFFQGRAGGARFNLPNHNRYLVLWNFKEIDEPEQDFRFIATDTWWWRIVPPIIVGFHGAGTTFNKDEVQILESLGTPVEPESLFEEQLKLRLRELPDWIQKIKE